MEKIERKCTDGTIITEYWAETLEEQAEIDAMVKRGELDGGPSFADQREQVRRRTR